MNHVRQGSSPFKVTRSAPTTDQERYRENMKLIASRSQETADQLESHIMIGLQLTPTASGRTTGIVWDVTNQAWVQLSDMTDPVAEAKRDADAMYTPDSKIFILIGSGMGYLVEEMSLRLRAHQRMAVFERSPTIFKAALHACDLRATLGDKRVDVFIGENVIPQMEQWFLGFQSHEKFHIAPPIRCGYTANYDAAFYESLTNKSVDMLRYHAVGLATWAQFGSAIGDNDIDNMPEYFTSPGLNNLKSAWEGKPAICVAAGPSLRKNLKLLLDPEVRNRVCVLAVGTVYGLLRSMGIVPDVVTSIDFQRLNWTDQFRLFPQDRRSALVYLHSVYPQIPRRWPGPRFVARNSSDTTEWLVGYDEPKMTAGQVQTVAHLNVVAAIEMGCSPIILMGQDLSMPPTEHHAPGAMAQDTTPEEAPDACVNADDIYGKPVQTRHSFLSMRTVFSKMFLDNPQHQFINCTEGGIHIDGSTDMKLSDVSSQIIAGMGKVDKSASEVIAGVYDNYKVEAKLERFITDVELIMSSLETLREKGSLCVDIDMNDFYDLNARKIAGERLAEFEALANSSPITMSMICVRRYDIVQALSAIEPNGEGVTEADVLKFRMQRTINIAKVVRDEYAPLYRNLRTMIHRVKDINEIINGTPGLPSHDELKRLLARQSYFSVESHLNSMIQEYGDSMYFQNDMRRYLWFRSRLAFHLQEFSKAMHIMSSHNIDPKAQAKCQKYIDKLTSRMLHYITPYLYVPEVKVTKLINELTELC